MVIGPSERISDTGFSVKNYTYKKTMFPFGNIVSISGQYHRVRPRERGGGIWLSFPDIGGEGAWAPSPLVSATGQHK